MIIAKNMAATEFRYISVLFKDRYSDGKTKFYPLEGNH